MENTVDNEIISLEERREAKIKKALDKVREILSDESISDYIKLERIVQDAGSESIALRFLIR
ncbi:MAG TPA: hypothetical protein VGI43_12670 [Mucilaginibacter sp.]|jgi:vacuolar-type H+-ATPase subunit H